MAKYGYSVRAIANYFIGKAAEEGIRIQHIQVQKLCYFAHGWHLALSDGKPLIREPVELWKYGPVYPTLYHELRDYGKNPIQQRIFHVGMSPNGIPTLRVASVRTESDGEEEYAEIMKLLDKIWENYGHFTGLQLSSRAHMKGTPWALIADEYPELGEKQTTIPDDMIFEYFWQLGEKNKSDDAKKAKKSRKKAKKS